MENHHEISESHLAIIQANINRLATASFLIKGWSVTLVSAILVLSNKDANIAFVLVAYFPSVMFWVLDGYFLGMERRFVAMYNEAASGRLIKHEVQPSKFTSDRACMSSACFSQTLLLFHGGIFLAILVVMFGLYRL